MKFEVCEKPYSLVELPIAEWEKALAYLDKKEFFQVIWARGHITLFLPEQTFPRYWKEQKDFRLITFTEPMDWNVVGFLSKVTSVLAADGIALGAICDFQRDHVFVANSDLEKARKALQKLMPEAS